MGLGCGIRDQGSGKTYLGSWGHKTTGSRIDSVFSVITELISVENPCETISLIIGGASG
jgi:hypothetical protein